MPTRLVVSLSGIAGRTVRRCAELAADLDRRAVPLSLLLTPRPAHGDRTDPGSPALRWVRLRQSVGDALVLHGFAHPDRSDGGWVPGARLWRRGEFAALPTHEAGLRLLAARAALERLELSTDCFAPPRWLASPGTRAALRRHGFAVCAEATAVHDLRSGAVHRARVHGVGRGDVAEPWWCWALVLGVARAARRGGLVRLGVDAADLARPGPRQAVLDAVDIALHHGAEPTTYAEFVSPARPLPEAPSGAGRRR
ncbi:DUF2334 domain-containing protein [Streptoalloteichus hindustanus]|uniref:DUF2334 domain-containing protein n=1 Tax=Streptoalloteichus hindustanus TaxID=2017 RepID=UPI000936F3CA|nr:DUF2334 domain-containing protein [Streptoalloteichus hindustanus]